MMSGTAVRALKEASITESGLNPECLIEIRWKVPSETTMPLVHTNRNRPRRSGAIEDRRQTSLMLAFAFESAAYRGEGFGQRKNLLAYQQVNILSSHRMPINTFGRYGDLRYKIGACKGDAFSSKTPQRNSTDPPVLFADLLNIQKLAELLGLFLGRNGCG